MPFLPEGEEVAGVGSRVAEIEVSSLPMCASFVSSSSSLLSLRVVGIGGHEQCDVTTLTVLLRRLATKLRPSAHSQCDTIKGSREFTDEQDWLNYSCAEMRAP